LARIDLKKDLEKSLGLALKKKKCSFKPDFEILVSSKQRSDVVEESKGDS
jgi:hypothetical protein